MPETVPAPVQNTAEKIKELYPTYIEMLRYFINEDLVEVSNPTESQQVWAHKASLGNEDLEYPFACLARASESAYKRRLLEGMPMLVDPDWEPGDPYNGFEQIECFHFLNQFAKDVHILNAADQTELPDGIPAALYLTPQREC